MKLLVSDYDDTLYTSDHSIKLNIEAIRRFRKNGNLFAISTARDFKSIKEEIEKYDIPYDFLSCYNSNAIYDMEDNVIYKKYLDSSNQSFLKLLLEDNKTFKRVDFFDEKGYIGSSNYNIRLGNIIKSIRRMNMEKIDSNKIITVRAMPNKLFNFSEEKSYLEENMKNVLVNTDSISVYASSFGSKADGIEIIKDITKVNSDDIYTIGNDLNDMEMINNYNGYSMLISHPKLYSKSNGVCTSVRRLIKKIDKK